MKRTRRAFAASLVLLIALFSFSIMAGATSTSNSQDGLVASITSDKDSYQKDEDIELTFKLSNTNDFAVKNVSMEAIIPDGLKLKDPSQITSVGVMTFNAGDDIEITRVAITNTLSTAPTDETATESTASTDTTPTNATNPIATDASGTDPTVTATDPTAIATTPTVTKSVSPTTSGSTGKTADGKVSTGDNAPYLLLALIFIACLAVAVVAFKYRKKAVKYLSLVLCVCITVGAVAVAGISNTSAEESASLINFSVSKTITVDDVDYTIEANIVYSNETHIDNANNENTVGNVENLEETNINEETDTDIEEDINIYGAEGSVVEPYTKENNIDIVAE